ncbi:MAG: DUF975 family protein [Lachnospiraceae bacterium]|nr:DUF975 family protein [Lachnospiraceae bacterium]
MTQSFSKLRDDSRDALAGNYMPYFIVLVITGVLTGLLNQLLSFVAAPSGRAGFVLLIVIDLLLDYVVMILAKMFQAGQYFMSLNIARYNRVSVSDLFLPFRYDTAKAFKLCAILALVETVCLAPFTVCVSNLLYVGAFGIGTGTAVSVLAIFLLTFGGIVSLIGLELLIAFPLSQALFLYIDHQEYSARECLSRSRSLMSGNVIGYFRLHLSLIGYFALCIVSLGLGLIWVLPYLNVIRANYYMNLTGTYKPY